MVVGQRVTCYIKSHNGQNVIYSDCQMWYPKRAKIVYYPRAVPRKSRRDVTVTLKSIADALRDLPLLKLRDFLYFLINLRFRMINGISRAYCQMERNTGEPGNPRL